MNRLAIGLAAIATLLHVIASLQYGYFRDELYFIACAHHLAWGYVDQPPLVAVAAWFTAPFGYALPALRLLPALAAGGTVFFTCALVRRLGGNIFAEIAAGLAALLLPANLFLGSTLTTTSFEPFTWTLVTYLLVCIVTPPRIHSVEAPQGESESTGYWYWLLAAVIFAFYAKYSIVLLLFSLAVGLLIARERRIFFDRRLYIAASIAIIAALPNVAWQMLHGWPIFEVLHNDVLGRHEYNSGYVFQAADFSYNAFLFAIEQLGFTNPLLVPIWITGLIALLISPRFARLRFIGIAYVVLFAVAILFEAKAYYIAGIYPTLCAAGIVAAFSLQKFGRIAASVLLIGAIALVPFTLPILPVQTLVAYEVGLGVPEARGNPPRLVQPLFAEEFGWNELARRVAQVYEALPPHEREHTAIFADNYGDAGALDFYGPSYNLPPALSGQNSYYLWSLTRLSTATQPTALIAVGATQAAQLRASFREVRMVVTYLHPYRWSAEGPTPIFLCRFPVEPLGRIFPRFRWYGA